MLEILKQCTIHGNVVKLPPGQLDRKLYQDVAKALNGIGGNWNKKADGFLFPHDPTALLAQIQGGKKVNLQKEFQAFYTPTELAEEMVEHIQSQAKKFLEPSAGRGALIHAIRHRFPGSEVDVWELEENSAQYLKTIPTIKYIGHDFTQASPYPYYDAIVANPPFSKNQDIEHFRIMWNFLAPGGTLVCILSNHWQQSSNAKETAFRSLLANIDSDIYEIPAGTFKESGTSIAACYVVARKPLNHIGDR